MSLNSPSIDAIASTFLPSYYPEARNTDLLPSYVARPEHDRSRHLLDGIDLAEDVAQSPHSSGRQSPARTWKPKDNGPWKEIPLYYQEREMSRDVSSDDYAQVGDALTGLTQALGIYEHLLSSLPHIRLKEQGQPTLQPLLALAAEGVSLIAPPAPSPGIGSAPLDRQPTSHPTPPKRSRDKDAPVCLGCGATDTPEWRRGPLGPRTLCNACVSAAAIGLTTGTGAYEDGAKEAKARRSSGEWKEAIAYARTVVVVIRGFLISTLDFTLLLAP